MKLATDRCETAIGFLESALFSLVEGKGWGMMTLDQAEADLQAVLNNIQGALDDVQVLKTLGKD